MIACPGTDGTEQIDWPGLLRGKTVWWSHGSAEPATLLASVETALSELETLSLGCIVPMSPVVERLCLDDRTRWTGVAPFGALFHAMAENRFDLRLLRYSQFPGMLLEGLIPADVALIQVKRLDDGSFNLGTTVDYSLALIEAAPIRVAQVNSRMPETCGETRVDPGLFSAVIESDVSLPFLTSQPPSAADLEIAGHVARLVPDGACLEIGWGSLGDAIWRALSGKRDLGVHTGFMADAVAELVESGVISNRRKAVFNGITVGTVAFGTNTLYRALHRNELFALHPSDVTHASSVISANDNMIAINSALEVDLSGQVNTEMAGRSYRGAIGGLADFVEGARGSRGGRTIITLRSRRGRRSSIVQNLSHGNVTLPSHSVDYVVTEYGIAELSGKSLQERRRAMIAIAHPEEHRRLEEN